MDKVLTALETAWSLLSKEGDLYLAVSGGMDSMVLLEGVCRFLPKVPDWKNKVHVLHVNHGLRGNDSDADEALVKKHAKACGFNFHATRLCWKSEKPTQANCRSKREAFFTDFLKDKDHLFLAHHLDDQAETIFLRLIRGTGLNGLSGMKQKNGKKIRPFLSLTKNDLKKAAVDWKVEWREDASNQSSKYERNWLRNEILPLLEKRRPGVNHKLAAVAEDIGRINKVKKRKYDFYKDPSGFEIWRVNTLKKLTEAELSVLFSLNRKHTKDLFSLLKKESGKCTAQGIHFFLSSGFVLVERAKKLSLTGLMNQNSDELFFESHLGVWQLEPEKNETWGLRSAFSLGDKGKKIFQEEKIPQFFREMIPICCKDKKVILATPKALNSIQEKRVAAIKFVPSKLADWFFTPSS